MEEAKGAVVSNTQMGLNIAASEDHFDLTRVVTEPLRDSKGWDDAAEDSEEEFAPLETIVPKHLQKKENLAGVKPQQKEPLSRLE